VITPVSFERVLAGPPLHGDAEPHQDHLARLGPLPRADRGGDVVVALEASGLLGRGGAGFPVGRKWRSMADRRDGKAVLVANGAEGEPPSTKDRALMTCRPHLVIDGAALAAESVGADEIIFYIGSEHETSVASMKRAMDERRRDVRRPMRIVTAPVGYVAGEATAAVNFINRNEARPMTTPPRMSERGVDKRPTLVQNVESLAQAALIARFGPDWYRAAGRHGVKGTALVTVSGAVRREGVREIEIGTTLGEVLTQAGGIRGQIGAVVLGGYFGTWADLDQAWDLPLDPEIMKSRGLAFGCGIIAAMPAEACGIDATAEIMAFLAREGAGQCGPCTYGLHAVADATKRVAKGIAQDTDLDNLDRWVAQIPGRGACRHPDGAMQLMASALKTFAREFDYHAHTGRCSVTPRWTPGA